MTKQEHQLLADYIKGVHSALRLSTQTRGFHIAWSEHCKDTNTLNEYSYCMKKLATEFWDTNAADQTKLAQSRILWIVTYIAGYFFSHELLKQRQKDFIILDKLKLDYGYYLSTIEINKTQLNILDVGSCYNPFKPYFINVTPIDIAPANTDVYECDFINVSLSESLKKDANKIVSLPRLAFDVVIFSFFLEYIPSSSQRKICCSKAYELLKPEGLLMIATPDSKHVGANSKMMKIWRYTLGLIGFSRIKYEKLPYMHCMAYRKSILPQIAARWSEIYFQPFMVDTIPIPQDSNSTINIKHCNVKHEIEQEERNIALFNELPFHEMYY